MRVGELREQGEEEQQALGIQCADTGAPQERGLAAAARVVTRFSGAAMFIIGALLLADRLIAR